MWRVWNEYSSHGWHLSKENARLEREKHEANNTLDTALSANVTLTATISQKDTELAQRDAENAILRERVEQLTQQANSTEQELNSLNELNIGTIGKALLRKLLKTNSFGQLLLILSIAQ